MLLEKLNIFQCAPDLQNTLLINRASGEAYLSYSLNKQYAVYFPKEGSVDIDFANLTGIFEVRWLNIMSSEWINIFQMPSGGIAKLSTPGPGSWIVLLSK